MYEQVRDKLKRNTKLNSVDFYNFDQKLVF